MLKDFGESNLSVCLSFSSQESGESPSHVSVGREQSDQVLGFTEKRVLPRGADAYLELQFSYSWLYVRAIEGMGGERGTEAGENITFFCRRTAAIEVVSEILDDILATWFSWKVMYFPAYQHASRTCPILFTDITST